MTDETRAKIQSMIEELDAAEREDRPAKWLDETRSGFDFSVFADPDERRAQQRHYRAHFAARLMATQPNFDEAARRVRDLLRFLRHPHE